MYKDSERREQSQTKTKFSSAGYAEPHPILSKDSERREQRPAKTKFSSAGYAEPHPILSKDSERQAHAKRLHAAV